MPQSPRTHRTYDVDGYAVLVGRGARENDRLSLRVARPRDWWLHVAGVPGSHVVVRNERDEKEPPRAVLERAARLAVWHSKAREAGGKVEVHFCRAADVSKPRGFAPGEVRLRSWSGVKVYAPDAEPEPEIEPGEP